MSSPFFVQTSEGYINLALVTDIKQRGDKVAFYFAGERVVELSKEEAGQIMDRVVSYTELSDSIVVLV